jgi:uncharacterized protein YkwD
MLVALFGLALVACGERQPANPAQARLPTAAVAVPPRSSQVIPLTPTPLPTAPATPTILAPTPTLASPTPAGSTPADLADADPAALENQLVDAINQVRQSSGLPAYRHSPELSAAARAHSCDLATHHIISHTSSDGRTLAERLAGSTPAWEWPSENIAAGAAEPAAVVALWMDEPPDGWHRLNILDPQQQEVGAGYCFVEDDPSGNHWYWTADFSRRSS